MTDKLKWMCSHEDCENPRVGTLEVCESHRHQAEKERKDALKPRSAPKPLKRTAINKDPAKWSNTFNCSDGEKVTENEIRMRLKICKDSMDEKRRSAYISLNLCDAYDMRMLVIDKDHTVAKARCKELGKTELIWDESNIEYSSRQAHYEWESYKSGEFRKHLNLERRMLFLKEHDHEGFVKRMEVLELFNRPKETI